jgi:uncharacterized protein GlcG (DUF336 family)
MKKNAIFSTLIVTFMLSLQAFGADVFTQKNIGLEAANDIARMSIEKCRKDGFNVSAAVVDKHGNLRTVMRDDHAARQTVEIAQRKANLVVMSGTATGMFQKARADIQQELNHIDGLIVMQGGLPITSGGIIIGAIGVSGAPGGDKDEACAAAALKKMVERLEFADIEE